MNQMVFLEGVDPAAKTALFAGLRAWRRDRFVYFEQGPWTRFVLGSLRADPIATLAARSLVAKARPLSVVIGLYETPGAPADDESGEAQAARRFKVAAAQDRLRAALEEMPPAALIELEHRAGMSDEELIEAAKRALTELIEGQ
ncbi:MAG TPA: hypothetical protein VF017_07030 [Thermoanaerobaculia bacterium]|nr:hypothetical protein [Thermoanaerobaculia bacterium]